MSRASRPRAGTASSCASRLGTSASISSKRASCCSSWARPRCRRSSRDGTKPFRGRPPRLRLPRARGGMPPGHARPAQVQAAAPERELRRQALVAAARRGHDPARLAARGRPLLHGQGRPGLPDRAAGQADAAAARARPHRVRGVLLALPRPHRARGRHDRAARLQGASLLPRRPPAPDADRLLLRRDDDRLRRDARLRGADRARRPLGDRRLRAHAAVQPVRAGLGGARGQARRARAQPPPGRRRGAPPVSPAKSVVLERLQKRSLAVGGVFLLALLAGFLLDRAQFFRSYLLGYLFWVEVAVGALGLSMLSHMTGGLWGVVPRRFHEAAARTFPALAIGFLPIALGASSLYLWARPEAVAEDALLRAKAPYLNVPFFLLRAGVYFVLWTSLAYRLSSWSRMQDNGPSPARGASLRGLSAFGTVLLFLSATFASVDWGMSLAPHWFSTIYGVLFIVSAGLSAMSLTILLMARLADQEPFKSALSPDTVHDLGKLLLTFTMLWGYVNFSQFLITWSGNLSEETPFYVHRLHGAWGGVA